MAMSDFEENFYNFGNSMYNLGVLMVITIILNIITLFSTPNLVLDIFIIVASIMLVIAEFYFWIKAFKSIKNVNQILHDIHLTQFWKNKLIGFILYSIYNYVLMLFLQPDLSTDASIDEIINLLSILILYGIVIYISWIFDYLAWSKLEEFFRLNSQDMFPGLLGRDAVSGSNKLKVASIFNLLFFFIITLILGIIFTITGYFTLGGALKRLKVDARSSNNQQEDKMYNEKISFNKNIEESNQEFNLNQSIDEKKFCPKCGFPIKYASQKFCQNCGNKI